MTNLLVKKVAILGSLFALMLLLQSCDPFGIRATGDDMTQTFDDINFHGLEIDMSATVEVHVDSVFKIQVTCEETAMPYVETKVTNGILEIYFSRSVRDLDNMKIIVSAPSWDFFELNGSGYIKIPDAISGNLLHVDISGSGNLKAANATFNNANLEVSGSGDLELAGSADNLIGNVSGSGEIDCLDFPVKTAKLKVSGSGKIKATVLEFLDAEISGSGDIEYEGNPLLNVHISGSGNVRKL
jgi:hypothetical protein